MTYEEKYKRAFEIAKEVYHDDRKDKIWREWLTKLFPELKESEDEKMRKMCIRYLDREYQHHSSADDRKNVEKCITWLEKQGEQKPTDKTGPKFNFKVGDWITNREGECYKIKSIYNVGGRYYFAADKDGEDCRICFGITNEYFHLWTIQDAKDGDVLVASDGSIFLFAGVVDCACKYYVALTTDNYVKINREVKGGYWETSRAVYPATKEQRDLLFHKMKEAGYEWDNEKKCLN